MDPDQWHYLLLLGLFSEVPISALFWRQLMTWLQYCKLKTIWLRGYVDYGSSTQNKHVPRFPSIVWPLPRLGTCVTKVAPRSEVIKTGQRYMFSQLLGGAGTWAMIGFDMCWSIPPWFWQIPSNQFLSQWERQIDGSNSLNFSLFGEFNSLNNPNRSPWHRWKDVLLQTNVAMENYHLNSKIIYLSLIFNSFAKYVE